MLLLERLRWRRSVRVWRKLKQLAIPQSLFAYSSSFLWSSRQTHAASTVLKSDPAEDALLWLSRVGCGQCSPEIGGFQICGENSTQAERWPASEDAYSIILRLRLSRAKDDMSCHPRLSFTRCISISLQLILRSARAQRRLNGQWSFLDHQRHDLV
jgi:hypothetical protein